MKRLSKELKASRKLEKVGAENPKKEFKIEIVRVGKLEENTAKFKCNCYECACMCPPVN